MKEAIKSPSITLSDLENEFKSMHKTISLIEIAHSKQLFDEVKGLYGALTARINKVFVLVNFDGKSKGSLGGVIFDDIAMNNLYETISRTVPSLHSSTIASDDFLQIISDTKKFCRLYEEAVKSLRVEGSELRRNSRRGCIGGRNLCIAVLAVVVLVLAVQAGSAVVSFLLTP